VFARAVVAAVTVVVVDLNLVIPCRLLLRFYYRTKSRVAALSEGGDKFTGPSWSKFGGGGGVVREEGGAEVCFDFDSVTRGLGLLNWPAGPVKTRCLEMTTDEDVYSRKKGFLEGQVRRLTAPLAPSRKFKASASGDSVSDGDRLSDTVIDNAIYKRGFVF